MNKVFAYQISDSIDIKRFRKEYIGKEIYSDSSELMYSSEPNKYLYIMVYGVVVFINYDEIEKSEFINYIKLFCKNILSEKLSEEFIVKTNGVKDTFGYNEITVSRFDHLVAQIVMINVAQSVALDYFSNQTELLLEETKHITLQLEKSGNFNTSSKKIKQFIGKSLNLKNRITEYLYILDSPEETWEDEFLNKIDNGLKKVFDIKIRYRSISEDIQTIKDNLDIFKDLIQHSKSNMLEWIIIVLIMVEVLNMIIEKLL
ncbi:MAG: RMD1 family protein [Bacteroidota bacterium]